MKILIVDDDTLILEILELYLSTIDYDDVTCAQSAGDALALMQRAVVPFDCIFLDISMPEMNGVELVPHIRSLPAYADTPVIMMTAVSDKRHIASAFVAGASDYIGKPFEFFELESQLQAAKMHGQSMAFSRQKAGRALDETIRQFIAQQRPQPGDDIPQSGLMAESAFENCLRNLKGEMGRKPEMLTLQMRNLLHDKDGAVNEDAEGFLFTLCQHIRDGIHDIQAIATYVGDGTFLAMTFATDRRNAGALMEAMRKAVSLTETTFEMENQRKPRFAFSEIRLHGEPKQAEPTYLIYAAKYAANPSLDQSTNAVGELS